MVTIINTNFLGCCQAHCIPGIRKGLILSSNNYKEGSKYQFITGSEPVGICCLQILLIAFTLPGRSGEQKDQCAVFPNVNSHLGGSRSSRPGVGQGRAPCSRKLLAFWRVRA